jgi:hypothetical protein
MKCYRCSSDFPNSLMAMMICFTISSSKLALNPPKGKTTEPNRAWKRTSIPLTDSRIGRGDALRLESTGGAFRFIRDECGAVLG